MVLLKYSGKGFDAWRRSFPGLLGIGWQADSSQWDMERTNNWQTLNFANMMSLVLSLAALDYVKLSSNNSRTSD